MSGWDNITRLFNSKQRAAQERLYDGLDAFQQPDSVSYDNYEEMLPATIMGQDDQNNPPNPFVPVESPPIPNNIAGFKKIIVDPSSTRTVSAVQNVGDTTNAKSKWEWDNYKKYFLEQQRDPNNFSPSMSPSDFLRTK